MSDMGENTEIAVLDFPFSIDNIAMLAGKPACRTL